MVCSAAAALVASGRAPRREPTIWLADHENLRPLMAVPTLYRNTQTMPGMEPIKNPSLSLLISGTMSLLRPLQVKHGSLVPWATVPAAITGQCSIIGFRDCREPWPGSRRWSLSPHAQEPGARAGADLDDWGITPLTAEQRRDLAEIVDNRHGRTYTVVTSQLPVAHWHEHIGNPTIADAVLDRLVHTAHRIEL